MKKILLFMLIALLSPSAKSDDKVQQCIHLAIAFKEAAMMRDMAGYSPQQAYKDELAGKERGAFNFSNKTLKKIVNLVYFNQKFKSLDMDEIYNGIFYSCVEPPKQWKPVR